jgi:hypothetical protein
MGKWISLPVEFKGIWYSPCFGGFEISLSDRFNPQFPPDRLRERLKKTFPEFLRHGKPHVYAEPHWMTREEFESMYGKVEMILVDKDKWREEWECRLSEENMLIFTDKYVVTIRDYDGAEYFIAMPRDYKQLLKGENQ